MACCIVQSSWSPVRAQMADELPAESWGAFYVGELLVFLATLLVALIVLSLTITTFDRCMGVPERAQRVRREPGGGGRYRQAADRRHAARQPDLAENECMTGGERTVGRRRIDRSRGGENFLR